MSAKLASSELDSRDLAKKKTHFGYWKIFSSENTRQTFEFEQYLNDHWILLCRVFCIIAIQDNFTTRWRFNNLGIWHKICCPSSGIFASIDSEGVVNRMSFPHKLKSDIFSEKLSILIHIRHRKWAPHQKAKLYMM